MPEEGCREPELYSQYRLGKLNWDWWTKEIGSRDKSGEYPYVREEFLDHLTPECFEELFKRYPRTHLVRWFFDNDYTPDMFREDSERLFNHGFEREPGGFRKVLDVASSSSGQGHIPLKDGIVGSNPTDATKFTARSSTD